jgi:tetratricopeptide (TPR) repeat protein
MKKICKKFLIVFFLALCPLSGYTCDPTVKQICRPHILTTTPAIGASQESCFEHQEADIIETYFKNFETLTKSEQWNQIIIQGTSALDVARKSGRIQDEAKICAQLTSTFFYQGNYSQALEYALFCHELSEKLDDHCILLRALYLESAVYRALAGKNIEDETLFIKAVKIAENAADIYEKNSVDDICLKGKIYFNWGAAHADHPKGDLTQAARCYIVAIDCFKSISANDDFIRVKIRLGKIYLLQKLYDDSQRIIDEIRPQISTQRIAMQADYLEAQLKLAIKDIANAKRLANSGIAKAESLGAQEDILRFSSLLKAIDQA